MSHIQTHPRQYAYTNLVDLVLSNPTNKPETHPLYIDANTGESITSYDLKRLVPAVHAGLKNLGFQRGDRLCVFSPNNACIYAATHVVVIKNLRGILFLCRFTCLLSFWAPCQPVSVLCSGHRNENIV